MNRNRMVMKKALVTLLCFVLLVPLMAACGKKSGADSNQERTLRIATGYYGPNDEYFRQQFTEIFEFANPNIKIETVPLFDDIYRYKPPEPGEKQPDPLEKMKELMQGANPPDVVMLSYEQLPALIEDNLLLPLDTFITKDKFDISDIVPAVIDGIKKLGDGKLYALAPTFSSTALIYNKRLFDEAGVPYPTDNMTWDQIFELARRVSKGEGENRKYGFSFTPYAYGGNGENLFHEMNSYTAPLQLKTFDDQGEKMTVDSDQWEKVWKTMLQLSKDKIFPEPVDYNRMNRPGGKEEFNPFQHDHFLSGRLAMTIVHYGNLEQIINANKNAHNIKGFTPIDWDVVTMPTHPEAPGIGGNVYMNGIMGINAKAQNQEDAWRFLKFINGEEWAKLKSRSLHQLVSRKQYIKPKDGLNYNIAAFYKLTPVPVQNINTKLYREKPHIGQVQSLGAQYFRQMLNGEKGVREALKEWQAAGDSMLQQMKENPNAPARPPEVMEKEAVKKAAGVK